MEGEREREKNAQFVTFLNGLLIFRVEYREPDRQTVSYLATLGFLIFQFMGCNVNGEHGINLEFLSVFCA